MDLKELVKLIITFVFILLPLACQHGDETNQNENGEFIMSLSVDERYFIQGRSQSFNVDSFKVEIYSLNDNLILEFDHFVDMPEVVPINVGSYYLVAHTNNDYPAEWENPYYYGKSNVFNVTSSSVATASVVCTLANTRATVEYTDDAITNFPVRNTVISNSQASLEYGISEIRAGFFQAGDSIRVVSVLSGGSTIVADSTFPALPRQGYHFRIGRKVINNSFNPIISVDPNFQLDTIFIGGAYTSINDTLVLNHTGTSQFFTVPQGVYSINVKGWGAGGAGGSRCHWGGAGGFASATIPVTPGEVLEIIVGGGGSPAPQDNSTGQPGGFGGGGDGGSGLYDGSVWGAEGSAGGGRTAIRRNGTEIFTIGGGGGAASCRNGGAGGGYVGEDAYDSGRPPYLAQGGTQTQGGNGAIGGTDNGEDGRKFEGGDGGSHTSSVNYGGGGGGGGFFGGGGGSGGGNAGGASAGAGGSSYVDHPGNTDKVTIGGVGRLPGNMDDPDRINNAGEGGDKSGGKHGLLIIRW